MNKLTNSEFYGYPSDYAEPATKKQKDWGLQAVRAIHSEYEKGGLRSMKPKQAEMTKARLYADGDQSTDLYKNWLEIKKNKSWININWDIVSIIPKYVDAICGYFNQLSEEAVALAIDAQAYEQYRDEESWMKAEVSLQEELAVIHQMLGMGQEQETQFKPKTMEEVEIYMNTTYKMDVERMMEEGIKLINQLNDLDGEVKRQAIRSVVVDGMLGLCRYRDLDNKIKIRAVDMMESLVGFSKRQDYRDIDKAGEYLWMTVGELKERVGSENIPEEVFKDVAGKFMGKYGNPSQNEYYDNNLKYGDFAYDSCKVRVLDFRYKTTNRYVWEKRYTGVGGDKEKREGQYVMNRVGVNYNSKKNDREVVRRDVGMWYRGLWVVGTDHLLEWEAVDYQNRKPGSLCEPVCDYYFYRPAKKSLVTRMIPFADQIQLITLKMQAAWAKARPKGMAVEMGAVEEISDGKSKLSGLEVMAVHDQTGNYYWRRKDVDDPQASPNIPPFQELEGGVGNIIPEGVNAINFQIDLLNQTTGMTEIFAATLPDPRQSVASTQAANVQSSNVLSNYYEAWITVKKFLAEDTGQQLKDMVAEGEAPEGYISAMGGIKTKFVKLTKDLTVHDFGIFMQIRPTDREKAVLENEIQAALAVTAQGGIGIELEDAFAVREAMQVSIKQAEQLLVSRRSRRKREFEESQSRMAQEKGAADAQAAQAAAQAEMQKMAHATDEQIRLEEAKAKLQIEIENAKHKNKMDQLRQQSAGKDNNIVTKGLLDMSQPETTQS